MGQRSADGACSRRRSWPLPEYIAPGRRGCDVSGCARPAPAGQAARVPVRPPAPGCQPLTGHRQFRGGTSGRRHGCARCPAPTRRPSAIVAAPAADWVAGGLPTPSTLFPPVRPHGYLEVRYLDAQAGNGWVTPTGLLAALMSDRHGGARTGRRAARDGPAVWADPGQGPQRSADRRRRRRPHPPAIQAHVRQRLSTGPPGCPQGLRELREVSVPAARLVIGGRRPPSPRSSPGRGPCGRLPSGCGPTASPWPTRCSCGPCPRTGAARPRWWPPWWCRRPGAAPPARAR
jgi:hypothetical protein